MLTKSENVFYGMQVDKRLYKSFLGNIFSDPCTIRFWDGEEINYGSGKSKYTIVFNRPLPISSIITRPSLTLGEAYMNGIVEIDGDIKEVIASIYKSPKGFLGGKNKIKNAIKPIIKNSLKKNKDNISYHYDIGNDFYKLWLDESMTYSCGYFENEDDTLEQAQMNKVDYILKKLNLKEGNTLLDIGCGWGELILAAARKYTVHALGITLSQEQLEKVNTRIKKEGLENLVDVCLLDYRQIKNKTFDRIVSVGMLEHVGKDNLEEYFSVVHSLLNDGGISLLHCITSQKGGTNEWIDRYIFPGGYVPSIPKLVNNITDKSFHLLDAESLRRHYARTLEYWSKNFEDSISEIRKTKDETFIRMWRLYLNSCAASFHVGNIDIHQFIFSKGLADDIPWTRKYLYEDNKINS